MWDKIHNILGATNNSFIILIFVFSFYFLWKCKSHDPQIIAISGKRHSGKDTVANFIKNKKVSIHMLRFATGLRIALEILTGIPPSISSTDDGKGTILTRWTPSKDLRKDMKNMLEKMWFTRGVSEQTLDEAMIAFCGTQDMSQGMLPNITVGRALQLLGTEVFRNLCHPDIWVMYLNDEWVRLGKPRIIIPDARFKNELEWLRRHKAVVWKVVRPSLEVKDGRDSSHVSEDGFRDDEVDKIIKNDKSLDDLRKKVYKLL